MKSKSDIEQRLRTLRLRYLKKHIAASQDRHHQNCVYNIEHFPRGRYDATKQVSVDMASSKSITLLVIQPDSPIRLCMYGSDNSVTWPGDVCDRDEIAKSCKWFQPRVSRDQARQEFEEMLANDEYVYENFPDIAAIQWVLVNRVHRMHLSLWEKFLLWLGLRRMNTPPPLALPESQEELPSDLWSTDDTTPDS